MKCDGRQSSDESKRLKTCTENRGKKLQVVCHSKKMRISNVQENQNCSSSIFTVLNWKKLKTQPGYFRCLALIECILFFLHPFIFLPLLLEKCDEDLVQTWWFIFISAFFSCVVLVFPVVCVLSHIRLSQGFYCDECRWYSRVYGYCIDCLLYLCLDCYDKHTNLEHLILKHNIGLGEKAESHCETCEKNVSILCITCKTRTCSVCNDCPQTHDLCIALNQKNVAKEEKHVDHCKACQAKVHFCFTCKMHILHTELLKGHENHNIIMALKPDNDTGDMHVHTSCEAKVLHYCRTCKKFEIVESADEHEGHEILVAFVPETEKKLCKRCEADVIYFCAPCYKKVDWRSENDHNIHKGHRIVMTFDPHNNKSHIACKDKMRRYCCSCIKFIDSKCTDEHEGHKEILAFETYAEYNHTIHCQKCKANVISFCFTCNEQVIAKSENDHNDHDVLVSLKPEKCNGGYGYISSCKTKVIRYCLECKDPKNPNCTGGQNVHNHLKAFALDGDIANHDGICKICRVNLMRFCPTCNKRVCLRCLNKAHEHELQKLFQHYGQFIVRNDKCVKCKIDHVECCSEKKKQFLCAKCFLESDSSSCTSTEMKCVVCKGINDADATVFCLICNYYMCSECFKWHRELDKNWDTADKFLKLTNETVKRKPVLSKCEIGKIIISSLPVIGLFVIILRQCCRGIKVGSACNDAKDGETTGEIIFLDTASPETVRN